MDGGLCWFSPDILRNVVSSRIPSSVQSVCSMRLTKNLPLGQWSFCFFHFQIIFL